MSDHCRSCGAPIIWAVTEAARRLIPIDAQPVQNGNIELISPSDPRESHIARVLGRLGKTRSLGPLHVSHFSTCPNAETHRRAR